MAFESARKSAPTPTPNANPLLAYTLQGEAAALEESAVAQIPLLGTFLLMGQSTVIAAPPNAGKTLITIATLIEAVDQGRINGGDIFYVNADDSTQGVAEKVRILDEYGIHMLAEGYKGFKANKLAPALEQMIATGTARGKFLILDTFKKFTQPMSKRDASIFLEVVRRFVLEGGTLLSLAHVNKHQDSEGRNVFAGVSDIIDDIDCMYVLDAKAIADGETLVLMTNKKRRGNNPDLLAYAYSAAPELPYLERLTSVHETDKRGELAESEIDYQTDDEDILESIGLSIKHGPGRGKMVLVRLTADIHKVSKRRVLKLLEAHTGDDPSRHRWRFIVGPRGQHQFRLLTDPSPAGD